MKNTVKIGEWNIEKYQNTTNNAQNLVPTNANEYKDEQNIMNVIGYSLANNVPCLLIGETGTGKTSLVRYACQQLNAPYRRINLNGGTTCDELIGKTLIKDGTTYFHEGVLIEAMRNGYVLVLDEINCALPEVLFVLQSLLDDDRMVVIDNETNEIVRPHKNFRIFATMNPSENYAGVRELNRALLSRFGLVVEVNYASKDTEVSIIADRVGDKRVIEWAKALVNIADTTRQQYKKQELDFVLSTRDIIATCTLLAQACDKKKAITEKDVRIACDVTFLCKTNKDDRNAIASMLDLHLGSVNKYATIKEMLSTQPSIEISLKENIGDVGDSSDELHLQKTDDSHYEIVNRTQGKQVSLTPQKLSAISTCIIIK